MVNEGADQDEEKNVPEPVTTNINPRKLHSDSQLFSSLSTDHPSETLETLEHLRKQQYLVANAPPQTFTSSTVPTYPRPTLGSQGPEPVPKARPKGPFYGNQFTSVSQTNSQAMSSGQKRRVKNKRISRRYIIGNEAMPVSATDRAKNPGIPEKYNIKWRLYLRNVEGGPDLSTWLDKVTFKIHDDFKPHNMRQIDSAPFEFTEFGFGGFLIDVRLHFQPHVGERPAWRHQCHFLQLEPYGTEEQRKAQAEDDNRVVSETLEIIEFNEPYTELWDDLVDENQWNYIEQEKARAQGQKRGKGKGQFPKLPPGQTAKDDYGNERTVELKDRATKGDPYSKQTEKELLDMIKQASDEVDQEMEKVMKRRQDVENQLKELKGGADLKKR